jgi:MATE family multidrug resistance protein
MRLTVKLSVGSEMMRINRDRTLEQSRLVLYVSLATVVVNFLGNWILIFGHLGAPALGADGAALSSVFATAFSIALYILLINTNASLRELRLFSRAVRVCLAGLWEVARLGIPIGLILLVEISFFTTAAVLVGGFGVAQLAGHQIAVQVVAFTLMFPLAIGHAATVRVALFAGSADPRRARIAAQLPLLITVIMMIALAVILWWQAQNIAAVFLGDGSGETYSATLIQAVAFLKIAAVFQIVDGLQATAAGVLRGYRDTLVPLWLASAAYWIVGIPLGYVLASQLGLAGRGVWLGMATALSLCALGMLLRVHSIARVVEPQNQTGDRL